MPDNKQSLVVLRAVGLVAVVLVSGLFGVLLTEIGFRAYLYVGDPDRFRSRVELPRSYGLYDRSLWRFSREYGFVYPPGIPVHLTMIADGKVSSCDPVDYVNKNGNIGSPLATHEDPDFTVAVFGDSWTAFYQQGKTWPHFLKAALERRLGKKVNVHNFGRDGYGVIQMFTLARDKIREVKPDLALFAFITDDLDRAPFWRTEMEVDGELRVLTTLDPVEHPSLERSADTMLLHPGATAEWCRAMIGKRDRIVEEIEDKYRRLLAYANSEAGPPPDILTLKHSYFYNRVVHKDATHFARRNYRGSQLPRIRQWSYREVPGFGALVADIDSQKVPWRLVHLAYYPEVKAGREYILTTQQAELLSTLEAMAGNDALHTLEFVKEPLAEPERINVAPTNFHPSVFGMEFYGDTVANMIIEQNLLPGARQGQVRAQGTMEPRP